MRKRSLMRQQAQMKMRRRRAQRTRWKMQVHTIDVFAVMAPSLIDALTGMMATRAMRA